ncbi:MAG TPA: hypothetical protein VKP30_02885, partial [Polyangiaceae bacterium]|nr:hypothetical protein [Polyangiaceae bacterium]
MHRHTSETREHGGSVPDVREQDDRRSPKNRERDSSVTENRTELSPNLAGECRLPGAPQFADAAARYLESRPAQSRQGAANQRRSESGFHRAVQRGASYVEHLVLIGILALALIGAFRGMQQAYAKLSSDEGKAIATFEWSRSTGESAGSALQALNDSGEPDPKDSDSKKKCDGWWDCAKEHTKDFFVEFGKAAKDDVVGMVTGTVTLVHNLVTNPKGVYDDAKALVDAIRDDPVGALKQLVWDEESSKLWASGDYGGAIGRTFWNV